MRAAATQKDYDALRTCDQVVETDGYHCVASLQTEASRVTRAPELTAEQRDSWLAKKRELMKAAVLGTEVRSSRARVSAAFTG